MTIPYHHTDSYREAQAEEMDALVAAAMQPQLGHDIEGDECRRCGMALQEAARGPACPVADCPACGQTVPRAVADKINADYDEQEKKASLTEAEALQVWGTDRYIVECEECGHAMAVRDPRVDALEAVANHVNEVEELHTLKTHMLIRLEAAARTLCDDVDRLATCNPDDAGADWLQEVVDDAARVRALLTTRLEPGD